MSVKATVLFGRPQHEIASLLNQKLSVSSATSIVTGFATPGGFDAIAGPIKSRPGSIAAIIIGAATYPGFGALEKLYVAGVPFNRMYVHLGHTRPKGPKTNKPVRYHPMMHSKIYYMELPGGQACAFIGSHNMTSFALKGLNGEAGVLLEGPSASIEFQQIRDHIAEARSQSTNYSPGMRESLAWWTGEFIDGLGAEVKLPTEWRGGRTVLIFAEASKQSRPKMNDSVYFELPAGIKVNQGNTETHLFLFKNPPTEPWMALAMARSADACYTCTTTGFEDEQAIKELEVQWRIDGERPPVLNRVIGDIIRPKTVVGMQQVSAKVVALKVAPYEYSFEQEKKEWDPIYSKRETIFSAPHVLGNKTDDPDDRDASKGWILVKGLKPREPSFEGPDAKALLLAVPDSGKLVLVSLRKRKKDEED